MRILNLDMAKTSKKLSPKIILIGVVAVAVIGVAAYMMIGKSQVTQKLMTSGDNAFTSIRDALSKSISLECTVTNDEGRVTKAYIKNGAVRADMTAPDPNEVGSMILKDNTLYTWSGTEGVMMKLPKEDYEAEAMPKESNQGDEFINDLEEHKESCKPAVVDDSLFTPPSDVVFSDMSQMMEGQMNEKDLQKMMEMYSDQ